MFSINAIAAAALSSTSLIKTGTSVSPTNCAARNLRSPAMISCVTPALPSEIGRTKIACNKPCSRIESANSFSGPSSMRVRGWYLPGCSCSSLKLLGSPSRAAAISASLTLGPSRASRPRPRPLGFFVAMRDCPLPLQLRQQGLTLGPVTE